MVLLLSVIVVGFSGWCWAQSPCPGVFDYQNDGSGAYGLIRLQPNGPLSGVSVRVNFTIATRLLSNYVGRLEPVNPEHALQRYNQGEPLQYRVQFPVSSPLPRLTSLVVNNRELCYGPADIPGPGQYVSTITLQHMLYLRGGSPNSVFYQQEPQYKPSGGQDGFSINSFNDAAPQVNTQVFNVNDANGNKGTYTYYTFNPNGSQSGGNSPMGPGQTFYTEQTTRPSFAPLPPQSNPDYNYFSEPEPPPPPPPPPHQYYPDRPRKPPPPPHRPPPFHEREKPRPRPPPPRPQEDQPPPGYNPYEQQTTEAPQAEQPPPNYNPYDTEQNKPNLPQTPPRLPSVPTLANHGDCGIIAGGNERVPLIFNGLSYNRGDWPWLVAIYKRGVGRLDFICSGTLISHKHVVTAAHCMHQKNSRTSMSDIVVKVGVYNLEEWGDDVTQQRTLESARIHESYNASTLANDILVFTFDRAVEFNVNIRPACLWSGKTDLNRIVGASGVVAGWGRTELGDGGHGEPRMARIPIVSTAACRASKPDFHKLTSDTTLCAGDRNGVGPCLGDSGGGLYILEGGRWRLRGIVSLSLRPENGDNTCNLNEYIVFTDSAKYLKWIKDIVQSSLF